MLKIDRISLENFLNVKSCDLDTSSRIVLITGPSGSGKSSIFEAIRTILSSKKRSDKYSEYVRQGCMKARIHLEATVNSKPTTFDVELNFKRGAAFGMTIQHGGKEYRNTEATDLLKSFDFDYYSDIVLTMQGDEDITELSPGARSVYLQRLLNFDFERQKTLIRQELELLSQKKLSLDSEISTTKALIEREIHSKQEPPDPSEYDHSKEDADFQRLSDEIREMTEKRTLLIELGAKKSELISKRAKLDSEAVSLDRRIDEIKQYEEDRRKSAELLESARRELQETIELISKIEKRIEEIDSTNMDWDEMNESESSILAEAERIKGEMIKAEQLMEDGICPHCGQKTEERSAEIIVGINSLVQGIINDDLFKTTHPDFKDQGTSLLNVEFIIFMCTAGKKRAEVETKKLLTERMEQMTRNNSSLFRKIDLEKRIKSLESQVDDAVDLLSADKLVLVGDKRRKMAESQRISQEIERLDQQIKESEVTGHEEAQARLERLRAVIQRKVEIEASAERIQKRNQEATEKIQLLSETLGALETQTNDLLKDKSTKEDAMKIFDKDLPNYMIVKTCASLQDEMNEFIHSVFPLYDVKLIQSKSGTVFNYTKDRTLPDGSPNAWINSKMSSGGEKALLSVAFKVALCKLYDLDICVLDECDKTADDESSDKLFDQVLSDPQFSQVWIISHGKNKLAHMVDSYGDEIKLFISKGGVVSEHDPTDLFDAL
jgi:chromosome segregation ATPase